MTLRYLDVTGREQGASAVTPLVLTGVTVTDATPAVFTKTAHGLVDGDAVLCSGFTQATNVNGEYYVVNQVNANTFQLAGEGVGIIGATEITAAETTGGTVTQILTPTPTDSIRVYYDDSTQRSEIVLALQRAKERAIEIL